MENNFNNIPDRLELIGRKKLSMTGVTSVDGFTEQSLKLTVNGSKVIINGENVKVTSYNKANGNLTAEGEISEIKYNTKSRPLVKRLFK